ncbi:MAG TPA: TldD/PmbA family protein [Polyangiaceae bacterium]
MSPADDATLRAMQIELKRSVEELKLPNRPPPYFVAYWTLDSDQLDIEATLGEVVRSQHEYGRRVHVELRVGSPAFDNSNFMSSFGSLEFLSESPPDAPVVAPQQDPFGLRHTFWLTTDIAYKQAVAALEQKNAARQNEVERKDDVSNFSLEKPLTLTVDTEHHVEGDPNHEALTRRISRVFRDYPEIQESSVHLTVSTERRYFVSSEGSKVVIPTPYTELSILCQTQADDGMGLSRWATLASLTSLAPREAEAVTEARRIGKELVALRSAPVMEDYSGPVLFEGKAAAQIVHDLLSEALSGTPPPKGAEAVEGPLARKLGRRILPPSFSLVDDPTLTEYERHPLLGHYAVDDEGVPPQRVTLVEQGRLRSFLMSRAPRRELQQSNGHGRSGLVGWARGRVGNLILKSSQGLPKAMLRARFLRVIRDEGSPFGLIVRELEPRPAGTNGLSPPEPELVYKVTPDGKEQLLRGGRFGQMSISMLRQLVAAGSEVATYDFSLPVPGGYSLPATVAAPSLLFEDVEVKKRPEPNKHPPLVPRP